MVSGRVILGVFMAVLAGAPAMAHHSTAGYDQLKQITLQGTVRKFTWSNPHMFIFLVVQGPAGTQEWTVETGTPNVNARNGWKPNSIKTGDKLTIVANPARSGSPDAQAAIVTLPNGKKLLAPGFDESRGAQQEAAGGRPPN